jgi:hypothetical protein
MAADANLLNGARAAGARLSEAERQALLARADYHAAIRRLHLAGTPLREIARALSVSHQRVQQIVQASGGSWWQVWRRRASGDAICTWCQRPPSEVAKLIAGPRVFICDDCIGAVGRVVTGAREPQLERAVSGSRARCDFCRKRTAGTRVVITGPANVCSECLQVCREILAGRSA